MCLLLLNFKNFKILKLQYLVQIRACLRAAYIIAKVADAWVCCCAFDRWKNSFWYNTHSILTAFILKLVVNCHCLLKMHARERKNVHGRLVNSGSCSWGHFSYAQVILQWSLDG